MFETVFDATIVINEDLNGDGHVLVLVSYIYQDTGALFDFPALYKADREPSHWLNLATKGSPDRSESA